MSAGTLDRIRPLDEHVLRAQYHRADPFPYFVIDDFLEPELARVLAASYPSYAEATQLGRSFSALNETLKVQICERERFPDPVRELDTALSSPEFLAILGRITGIPKLLADEELVGGGMHMMASGGHLDVHVDFNLIEERQLHRRLNLLVFFNEDWEDGWEGKFELWDSEVKARGLAIRPDFNRLVVFETSEKSFHGVTPIVCPEARTRNSFAVYYYTREAPLGWDGRRHTTVFRARPDEALRGRVLMPAERALSRVRPALRKLKRAIVG
jgi:hypothetical protein